MRFGSMVSLAVLGAVALAACSDRDHGSTTSGAGGSASDAVTITPDSTPSMPKLKRARGVIADTVVDACSTEPGALSAHGTVTNTARHKRDLVVTNTGTTRIRDIAIDDPMLASADVAVHCPKRALDPGTSMVCESAPYTLTATDQADGGVTNVATSTGRGPDGPVTSDESTVGIVTDDATTLPDTGAGFAWWMPLAGFGLLGAGLTLLVRRRRVHD